MSSVLNAIVTFPLVGDDEDAQRLVNELNAQGASPSGRHPPYGFVLVDDAVLRTGGKALEQHIAVAALNYVDEDELLRALRRTRWPERENVRCFVCGPEEEAFRPIRLPLLLPL
jgi:hypothetical protein